MTKAEEVRKRRHAMMDQEVSAEAEKVFDWILDLIDADTEAKRFRDVQLYLFKGETTLKTKDLNDTEYDLRHLFYVHDKVKFFETLKAIVEREGFTAVFNQNTEYYDTKCMSFTVVIG